MQDFQGAWIGKPNKTVLEYENGIQGIVNEQTVFFFTIRKKEKEGDHAIGNVNPDYQLYLILKKRRSLFPMSLNMGLSPD